MMTKETIIVIGVIVLITATYFLVSFLMNKAVDKAADAIQNSRTRKKEQKNPPQAESLAARYGVTEQTTNTQRGEEK